MRYIVLFLLTLFFALFNTSFITYIGILSVLPDIFLIYVVCIGLLEGKITAGIVGLLGGLFIDTTAGSVLGLYSFVYVVVGIMSGIKLRDFSNENVIRPAIYAAAATVISAILIMLITMISGTHVSFFYCLVRYYLPAVLYNVIIMELVFFLLRHLYNRNFMAQGISDLELLLKK